VCDPAVHETAAANGKIMYRKKIVDSGVDGVVLAEVRYCAPGRPKRWLGKCLGVDPAPIVFEFGVTLRADDRVAQSPQD
jgi:hypothetical protein